MNRKIYIYTHTINNMTKNDERIHMIGLVLSLINKCSKEKKGANKEKILALLSVNYGVSRRTGMDYIKTLILADKVVEEVGDLWIK